MPSSTDQRDKKALEILSAITRVIEDRALPLVKSDLADGSDAAPSITGDTPGTTKKITVADVLAANSPYRKIDSETGIDFIDTSGLHISQMDTEDVRKNLDERIAAMKEVRVELKDLAAIVEKKILSKGPVDVKVDTKKDVNLRRAISRTYGKKTNVITFEMYKKALALRRKIRRQEVEETSGRELGKPHDKKA